LHDKDFSNDTCVCKPKCITCNLASCITCNTASITRLGISDSCGIIEIFDIKNILGCKEFYYDDGLNQLECPSCHFICRTCSDGNKANCLT